MEIIVWIILFSILMGVVLVLQYWSELVRSKETYSRDELLDFLRIIPDRLKRLAGKEELGLAIMAIVSGIAVGWLLTLLGGVFAENVAADVPDHAEGSVPNYFFQSALFVFVLHIAWPSFKEFALDRGGEDGMFFRVLSTEIPFFVGLAVTIASINLTSWGVYHEMSFLFCFPDIIILLAYAGYRIDSMSADFPDDDRPLPPRRKPAPDDEF
ncbi:MAG: hypothetical protein JNM27_19355 [Leptospirales bacterium]|nr:hypothetical protein [Leptospirales bacterium]